MAATLSVKTIMASFPAYGGSVQGLAANELAMSAEERAAHEAVLHDYIAQHNAQQQQARQAQQDAEQRRQFDLGQTERQAEQARIAGNQTEQNRLAGEQLKLGRDYFDLQKAQPTAEDNRKQSLNERKREVDLKRADFASKTGRVVSKSEFPNLADEDIAAFADQTAETHRAMEEDHSYAANAAAALNRLGIAKRALGDYSQKPDFGIDAFTEAHMPAWVRAITPAGASGTPNADFKRRKAGAMEQAAKAEAIVKAYPVTPGLLLVDPATGMYKPAKSLPWMNQPMPPGSGYQAPAGYVPPPNSVTADTTTNAMSLPMPPSVGTNTVTNTPARIPLTPQIAQQFLLKAGGDKNIARQMAAQAGYAF